MESPRSTTRRLSPTTKISNQEQDMSGKGESKLSVLAAIAANIAIGVIKFIAAAISGSAAMLSEGIHSIVDSGNG
ncbi:MAG: cation transporter, partial [Coriobacteriales bacterium]|nr:cation transporter [Coriobacteriales bacterium]